MQRIEEKDRFDIGIEKLKELAQSRDIVTEEIQNIIQDIFKPGIFVSYEKKNKIYNGMVKMSSGFGERVRVLCYETGREIWIDAYRIFLTKQK